MPVLLSPEPQNHQQATANIYIEGLGLMHFDLERRTWDITFPRNGDHKLILSIERNGQEQIPSREIDPGVSSIEISAEGAIPPDWAQFPGGYWFSGSFNRRGTNNHDEDFRWVTDLANFFELPLHGVVRRRSELGASFISLTTASVPNVIFYTKSTTFYELTLAPLGLPLFYTFGKTNRMVGADIFCEEGGAVIVKIDGTEYAHLPHMPGSPYEITMSNYEPFGQKIPADRKVGEFKRADFRLYYELVDVFAGYDMHCPVTVLHTRDCDCDVVRVSNILPSRS